MNKATVDRLKNNPHYKFSAQQRAELEKEDKPEMVEFGAVPLHNQNVPVHPTGPARVQRSSKKW